MRLLIGILLIGLVGCGDPAQVDWVTPTPTATPSQPEELTNPYCVKTMGADGPGGFVWKPKSESDGKLVILFPEKFERDFEKVIVYPKAGGMEGLNCYARTNGNRLTCRGQMPGGRYTGLITALDVDQVCEWSVTTPKQRVD